MNKGCFDYNGYSYTFEYVYEPFALGVGKTDKQYKVYIIHVLDELIKDLTGEYFNIVQDISGSGLKGQYVFRHPLNVDEVKIKQAVFSAIATRDYKMLME